jgi:hypothetical protein
MGMTEAQRAKMEKGQHLQQIRRYCGNDGGLLNAESSPHLFWLAAQLEENRC